MAMAKEIPLLHGDRKGGKLLGDKGLSLVEVLVSMALLSLIVVSVVMIFAVGTTGITTAGDISSDINTERAHLERAIADPAYGENVTSTSATIPIFGTDVTGRDIETESLKVFAGGN